MNFIFTRRSVRQFTDKKIEKEKIIKILSAAMQAPSAGNQQPWEFIVIDDKNKLSTLSNFSPYASCLKNATSGIIVLSNSKYLKFPDYVDQDLGACTQNLLLETVNQGLGAVWLGAKGADRENFISKFFDLPSHVTPFAVIALGYPTSNKSNYFLDRFDDSRIHFKNY